MNFIEELGWRGMIHDMMPGLEDQLKKELTSAYVGIDPDSRLFAHWTSCRSNDVKTFPGRRTQTHRFSRRSNRYDW